MLNYRITELKFIFSIIAFLFSGLNAFSNGSIEKHAQFKKNEIFIIDVRTEGEYSRGHIKGAILIPYDEIKTQIAKKVKSLTAPIAVYCQSGGRSQAAYRTLISMGYTNVVNYGSMSKAEKLLINKN